MRTINSKKTVTFDLKDIIANDIADGWVVEGAYVDGAVLVVELSRNG